MKIYFITLSIVVLYLVYTTWLISLGESMAYRHVKNTCDVFKQIRLPDGKYECHKIED